MTRYYSYDGSDKINMLTDNQFSVVSQYIHESPSYDINYDYDVNIIKIDDNNYKATIITDNDNTLEIHVELETEGLWFNILSNCKQVATN